MNWRRWTYFIFWTDPNFHSQTRLHTSKENVWNKDIGDTNSDNETALFLYKSAQEDFHIYKEGSRIYENLLWFSFPWGACLWEGLNCTRSSETCSSPAPTLHTYYISHILHILYIIHITYYTHYILHIHYTLHIYHISYILHITYYSVAECWSPPKSEWFERNFKLLLTMLISFFPQGLLLLFGCNCERPPDVALDKDTAALLWKGPIVLFF